MNKSQAFIDLLLISGFVISANQTRLYFDDEKMNQLLDVNKLLQHKLNQNDKEEKKEELDQEEEKEEKKEDEPLESNDMNNKDTVLSYFMNMGYDKCEILDALNAANNDIEVALDILLNGTIEQHKFVGTTPQTKVHLKELMKISETERLNGMKLFYDICSKLLNNMNNEKYHNLNYETICNKFKDCKPCIDLLQDAGFMKSKDGTRLIFNTLYIKHISNVMQEMSQIV